MRPTNRRALLQKLGAAGLCATPLMSGQVFAAVFMEAEQAHRLLLPNADTFQALAFSLDELKLNSIARASDTRITWRR